MTSFNLLGISPALTQAATQLGLHTPTAIQTEAIPAILRGADLLALAQTGSGKTAAFALPLLQRLMAQPAQVPRPTRVLVLVPTRELAAQVGEVFVRLLQGAPQPLKVAVLLGGVSLNPQMMGLRGGAEVVVATPGRLLDLIERNALGLAGVEHLVLDEADRLLELGFAQELTRVLALLPARRQNLFFSATFPPALQAVAQPLLHEPVRLEIAAPPTDAPLIAQRAIEVDPARRTELLRHLIREGGWTRALVFVATRYDTEHVAWKLYKNGLFATPFHGEMSQGKRTQVLEEFKQGQWDVVVTTDLAARGIDIVDLPVVVNYDLPRSATDHVHRIGRTGRAGASGLAVSFVSAQTEAHFRLIEKRQNQRVPREQVPGFEPAAATAPQSTDPHGGIKGKRPSKKDKLRAAAQTTPPTR